MMVHDRDGNVLNVGRKSRKIPAGLRRALSFRDRGCRYPGCPSTRVDAHHVDHWADGGDTKLSNLMLLCRYHHVLHHEGGYSIRVDAQTGEASFYNNYDQKLARTSPRPAIESTPIVSAERWQGVDIGWRGIDYGYIVAGIVDR